MLFGMWGQVDRGNNSFAGDPDFPYIGPILMRERGGPL